VFKHPRLSWLPFYLLVPLAIALLFLDEDIPMPSGWRPVILLAIVLLIGGLAVNWIERHAWLIERERLGTRTYRVVSYPWSVFQRPPSTSEDDGSWEVDCSRHEETDIRHARQPSDD
jgi:hypothetical protein